MYSKLPLDKTRYGVPTVATILLLSLTCQPLMADALIKCWQNRDNIRECSKVVPPEYAQQRIEVLNEYGTVVKVIPAAKTPAEREEDARREKLKQAEEERKKHDRLLLRSYAAESDLIDTRDKQLTSIQAVIDVARGKGRSLMNHLRQLQKDAANFERSGGKVPKKLLEDIRRLNQQIKENRRYQYEKQQAMYKLDEKFLADLKRYRALKKARSH